jgi:hypothetical protein
MKTQFNIDYIEFGKIFQETESTDFLILDRSNSNMLEIAGQNRCERFFDYGLRFPPPTDTRNFTKKISNVSCCFVKPANNYYLFIQVQRREEGEFSKFLGNTPRLNRPYNQTRFSFINQKLNSSNQDSLSIDDLQELISQGYQVYSGLLYKKNQSSNIINDNAGALKDYIFNVQQNGQEIPNKITFTKFDHLDLSDTLLKNFVNHIVNYIIHKKEKVSLQISEDNIDWMTKLSIIEKAQYLLWPIIGIFTFSIDYISDRNDINLLFFSERSNTFSDREIISIYQNSEHNYHSELLDLQNNYQLLLQDNNFITSFRNYFIAQISIPDAAYLASLSSGNNANTQKTIQLLYNNYSILNKLNIILTIINKINWPLIQLLQFYLEYIESLSAECKKAILDRLSINITSIPHDSLTNLVRENNFQTYILIHKEIMSRFLPNISYDEIFLCNNNELLSQLFEKKTLTEIDKTKVNSNWFEYYLIFKKINPQLAIILLVKLNSILPELLPHSNDETKKQIYHDLILNEKDINKSDLVKNWIPQKDLILDSIIVGFINNHSINYLTILSDFINNNDLTSLNWFIQNVELDKEKYIKILSAIKSKVIFSNSVCGKFLVSVIDFFYKISFIDGFEHLIKISDIFLSTSNFPDSLLHTLSNIDLPKLLISYLNYLYGYFDHQSKYTENPELSTFFSFSDMNLFFTFCSKHKESKLPLIKFGLIKMNQSKLPDFFQVVKNDIDIAEILNSFFNTHENNYDRNLLEIILNIILSNGIIEENLTNYQRIFKNIIDTDDDYYYQLFAEIIPKSYWDKLSWNIYQKILPVSLERNSRYGWFRELIMALDSYDNNFIHRLDLCKQIIIENNNKFIQDSASRYIKDYPSDESFCQYLRQNILPTEPKENPSLNSTNGNPVYSAPKGNNNTEPEKNKDPNPIIIKDISDDNNIKNIYRTIFIFIIAGLSLLPLLYMILGTSSQILTIPGPIGFIIKARLTILIITFVIFMFNIMLSVLQFFITKE